MTLEADEFICVACGRVTKEHPLDGMGECMDCLTPQDIADANEQLGFDGGGDDA